MGLKLVLLAGGTGGAKLAAGVQEEIGADLTVIANTGDDIETLGVHISPDPDLCTYWLSGAIDAERGWGIKGDSFTVFERLVKLGAPDWFGLGDRDLATCLRRRALLDRGARPTEAQLEIGAALGLRARVLPMCDEPVRTRVKVPERGWRDLQEYLVHDHAKPEIEAVEFVGIEAATPTPEVRSAVAAAEVIVIGPSNPVISIGPILAVPGMSELLAAAAAPVVAVSPFVAGEVIKGPTDMFMRAIGKQPSVAGVIDAYREVIDGVIVDAADPDPPPDSIPTALIDTLMDGAERRREVATETLAFCESLRRDRGGR
ncbi:MAG: 2-phospho-L-lactate transferase [Thermoleophilia bacterium]|nr:2-phospho-L-lactate transferase [Thermoleophilia bacterium]